MRVSHHYSPAWGLRLVACLLAVAAIAAGAAQAQAQAPVPAPASQATLNAASASGARESPVPATALPAAAAAGVVANPYGLRSVWAQGDLVARATLLALALMSLASWYIILAKFLEQRRLNRQAFAARAAFAGTDSLRKAAETLSRDSLFRFIVDSALAALKQHDSVARQVDINTWLAQDIVRSVGSLQLRSQSGLALLATVGSTAPFVGLFGTVWGIYNALVTIGISGQASIDKVAGPVGEALIMTALGLAVAVPAVLGYNWLVRRNRLAMHALKGFSSDLHTLLLMDADNVQRAPGAQKAT